LISDGLRIISESYLDHAQEICQEREVLFERRVAEGRNYVEILREIGRDGYGLVALGALGLGARRRSLIGSVSERVLRRSPIDVLLARKTPPDSVGILAAVDGSPNSFKAVDTALQLGRALGQPVEVVSVFDPQFHVVAFRSIANVLSEEGAKLFRFQEQQKLHEEIIDKGLEKLYKGHLDTAAQMAERAGQPLKTTLLQGKAFQQVLDHVDHEKPLLLVAGRFGLHRTEYADMGSTSENLARLARCSVLVVDGELVPEQRQIPQPQPEPEIRWTEEAEARLENVPPFARGMARQAIEGYARQHGYAEVTEAVMAEARAKMGM
jgi:nucleotide-binding universal stress UspA family protein